MSRLWRLCLTARAFETMLGRGPTHAYARNSRSVPRSRGYMPVSGRCPCPKRPKRSSPRTSVALSRLLAIFDGTADACTRGARSPGAHVSYYATRRARLWHMAVARLQHFEREFRTRNKHAHICPEAETTAPAIISHNGETRRGDSHSGSARPPRPELVSHAWKSSHGAPAPAAGGCRQREGVRRRIRRGPRDLGGPRPGGQGRGCRRDHAQRARQAA